MKKIFIIGLIWVFFIPSVFSQNEGHGFFVKRIEYKVLSAYSEKPGLFFGNFDAPVEFNYLPSSTAAMNKELISSFRIVRNSSNILEVKYISNYVEAEEAAKQKYPIQPGNITSEHNKTALAKQHEEMLKLYKIETLSFPISNRFAEKLYEKMVSLIDNFKAKGVPPVYFGGYSVLFRNVVDDEVWSLRIDQPNGDALKMSDLCRQIIKDAISNKFDESKYITVLDSFEN